MLVLVPFRVRINARVRAGNIPTGAGVTVEAAVYVTQRCGYGHIWHDNI